jgi:hypothetical protein
VHAFLSFAVLTLAQVPSLPPARDPGSFAGSACAWIEVQTRDTGHPHNVLAGVAAIAPDDVWAVGASGIFGDDPRQIVQHWDGALWNQAAPPAITAPNELAAVSAVRSDDVWAVGAYDAGGQSLIEHWDGASWSVVPNPNPALSNRFAGVAAASSHDVWAVGAQGDGGLSRTLIERWNGASWSVVPSPNVSNQHNQLFAVSAVPGVDEAWAVGRAGPTEPLILHWNGAQWSLVPSPSRGTVPILTGVVALASNDVWAVGWTGTDSGPVTLIEHWDGSAWSVVPSPSPGPTFNYLWGVGASGPNGVWAVGEYVAQGGQGRTLILRWDGASWTHVPGDDTGPIGLGFSLRALDATSATDVWAVGTSSQALTEHWDGSSWRIVAAPNADLGDNVLHATDGNGSDAVWAVGYSTFGTERRTLVERWDGAEWSIARTPNTNKRLNELRGVAAISSSDAWAVGFASSGSLPDQTTLVLRWNGSSWRIVPSPSPGVGGLNELHAVDAIASGDAWAVGEYTPSPGYSRALVEHWNGAAWSVVPTPSVAGNSGFNGVVALAPDDVWAVGYQGVSVFSPLIEHWDGASWSVVPSPDPQTSSNILTAVAAAGTDEIWAVGWTRNLFTFMTGALIQRWDGAQWTLVAGGSGTSTELYGVAAAPSGDAWAVGNSAGLGLVVRWDGSAWNPVPTPNLAARLEAATAITAGDVWAVGQQYVPQVGFESLSERWTCDVETYCTCGTGVCGNADPGAGCANSTGGGARLFQGSGTTSVAADDLVLATDGLPPNRLTLTFMGGHAANLPFSDGRLCVSGGEAGVFRYPPLSSGPFGSTQLGPGIVAGSQAFPPDGHVEPGSTWHFQTWYRDPSGPCGSGTNLSNAARVTFRP